MRNTGLCKTLSSWKKKIHTTQNKRKFKCSITIQEESLSKVNDFFEFLNKK